MHELHLAQGILESAIEQAARHGGKRISALHICVGETSHVTAESLGFCFAAASKGTIAEGARVDTRQVPGLGQCRKCGYLFHSSNSPTCPKCGSDSVENRRSDIFLESLELD